MGVRSPLPNVRTLWAVGAVGRPPVQLALQRRGIRGATHRRPHALHGMRSGPLLGKINANALKNNDDGEQLENFASC